MMNDGATVVIKGDEKEKIEYQKTQQNQSIGTTTQLIKKASSQGHP